MIRKNIYTIIVFIQVIFTSLEGQDVSVKALFDSSRIYIGDQINFTITVDQPSDIRLEIPFPKDTLCKNIEILSGPLADSTSLESNRLRITNRYLVTSFDSGYYVVPPIFAEIRDESGIKRFYSGYSQLEVMRVRITPADTASHIFDIVAPFKAPVTFGEMMPWILLLLLLSSAAWVILKLLRRFRKRKDEPEVVVNPDPAHITAFRELEKLRGEQLWQKGEVKLYYSRLTEILRQYLENRYGVYSLEMTTSETLEALVSTGFRKDEHYNRLKTILNASDLVKFAKYKPEPSENDIHFQNSWSFVESTMIKEEIPSAEVKDEKK